MWLIFLGLCVSFAPYTTTTTTSDYHIHGFDCSNKDFLWNISTATATDFFESDEIERETVKYQLVQETQDSAVEIHELKVTRTMVINQCGSANNAWSW